MWLLLLFLTFGLVFAVLYILGRDKFSPANLLMMVWLLSIAVAQLRLSPIEKMWTIDFWLILFLFFTIFYTSYKIVNRLIGKRLSINSVKGIEHYKIFFVITSILTLASVLSNLYIYSQFGTMPVFSSSPDKMRFIINKNIFGLFEYMALLPRLYIPLLFFYLQSTKKISVNYKLYLWLSIALGFLSLFLYASRLVIVLPILLCYFIYLYLQYHQINFKQIIVSSLTVVLVVLAISVSIPAFRNYITYRDFYAEDINYTPFTYLVNLSEIDLPANLNWIIPIYIIPSFNLQAMLQATTYYNTTVHNFYGGGYYLSVFNPLFKILHLPLSDVVIPWEPMFLSWWVTATFLFSAWADFGYLGIIMISIFWGTVLALSYEWATKKPTLWSIMLISYLSFVVIMSIYADYLTRAEFYLDVTFIFLVGYIFSHTKKR